MVPSNEYFVDKHSVFEIGGFDQRAFNELSYESFAIFIWKHIAMKIIFTEI